ncbi:MAG TPA: radical SAM protein [Dehalococcoidia bacterium]|nr:radical SAM protein [Dehalococcoidia bacterium]
MSFERPLIIRPPSEWKSYFLPLTSGCSNNTCAFCGYFGSKLQMRDIEGVRKEIDALAALVSYGLDIPGVEISPLDYWDGKRVFLQDADALVYPFPKLKEILEYLNKKFPNLERIAAYATPQDLLRRDVAELNTLKELKLGILYTGLESGSDEVLQRVNKGLNSNQIIKAARKAKEAGVTMSITVILGLAGIEGSEKHVEDTARVLSEIDPEYAGALTLTLVPGTPLYEEWKEGNFHLISPFQSLEELKTIIERANFTNCFFSSMHASNYQAIRGRLPQDKEGMIEELGYVLTKRDPSSLRPEFSRGL